MAVATFEFHLTGGRQYTLVQGVETIQKAATFASALAGYSNAGMTHVQLTTTQEVTIPEQTGLLQSLDIYALVIFRDAEGLSHRVTIPAPILSQYNQTASGIYLKSEHGATLAYHFGLLLGKTLTYYKGAICGQSQ